MLIESALGIPFIFRNKSQNTSSKSMEVVRRSHICIFEVVLDLRSGHVADN